MTIVELVAKADNASIYETRDLAEMVSANGVDDILSENTIVRIIEESKKGRYRKGMSKNAVNVIMERCTRDANGKINFTNEGVQVPLGVFSRVVREHIKEKDGTLVPKPGVEPIRAEGTVIPDWIASANILSFMEKYKGGVIEFTLKSKVITPDWDAKENTWSATKSREQKVFNINWVSKPKNEA
jgi:hypothetical protein